ncbi:MAG: hypothetical protein NVS9B3_14450 [Gemmatimonadaceae bacterium]
MAACWAALGVFVGAAHPAAAQSARNEDTPDRPEVVSLALRGVQSVDRPELERSIATEESHCLSLLFRPICLVTKSHLFYKRQYLSHAELERDVLRIRVVYWRHGFREAEVDTSVVRVAADKVKVAFDIREGRPTVVGVLRVSGVTGILSDRDIDRARAIRSTGPLDLPALDTTVAHLRDKLWELGYADAVLKPTVSVDTASRTARVEIAVDPKALTTVGEITVAGNHNVSESTIRHSLTLGPGDVYRREEVLQSQRNLYESNLFRHAVIKATAVDDSIKPLEVSVEEAPLREVRASGGFNTVDYFQVDGRYTNYNWFGGARRLDVQGVVGNLFARSLEGTLFFTKLKDDIRDQADAFLQPTYQVSADVKQPWLGSPRNSRGVGVFAHRRLAPGVFVDRGYGATGTFTRLVASRSPLSLNYRFEITRVDAGDIYFCANYGVCDAPTVGALRAHQRLSPIGVSLLVDRSDAPFNPSSGYTGRTEFEHASSFTLSDFRYNRAFADAAVYTPVGRSVLALHARAGWVRALASTASATRTGGSGIDLLHPRKRFYAGGSQSVRGFGENQLGPRILTVSPALLAAIGCDTSYAAVASCDLHRVGTTPKGERFALGDGAFTARALGGTTLLEGSAELRFPLFKQLGGAVFVDGAAVGESPLTAISRGSTAITPGFGVRYYSPVGPIRIDVGVNPTRAEDLSVVTQATRPGERDPRIVQLTDSWRYDPAGRNTGIRGTLDRLTLHLSIGQAF